MSTYQPVDGFDLSAPLTPTTDLSDTGRVGTLRASREEVEHALGAPHYECGSADDKITHQWAFKADDDADGPNGDGLAKCFATSQRPGGGTVFALYDYWWNPDGEYSIGGRDGQAACLVEAIFPGKVSF